MNPAWSQLFLNCQNHFRDPDSLMHQNSGWYGFVNLSEVKQVPGISVTGFMFMTVVI